VRRSSQTPKLREENRARVLRRVRSALACSLLAFLLLPVGAALETATSVGTARADEVPPPSQKKKKKKNFAVTPAVFKKLTDVHELLEAEQTDEALALLDKLREKKLTLHETAIVYQTYGFAYSNKSDYPKAAESFEKCLETEALPDTTLNIIRYNLGQLYMAMEEFEKALVELKRWMNSVQNPGASAYHLIGIAHAQLGQTSEALPYIEKAVALSKDFKEGWLQLLLALYFEEGQLDDAVGVLTRLINHSPKESYLQQLQGIYGEMGQEKKALAVMELSYRQGYLDKDADLRNLARLYLYHEVPVMAANVLEQGLEDGIVTDDAEAWELLADSWIYARNYDKAMPPLRKAADRAEDGNIYIKLARVFMEEQKWNDARSALEAGIAKGDLDDVGDAHVMLGITLTNTQRYASARKAFKHAARAKSSKQSATTWLKHLETLEANAADEAEADAADAASEAG
jgi:tetratricopeptide (TPR) repeat protein